MNLTRKSGTAHQHCKVQTEIKFPAKKKRGMSEGIGNHLRR